MRYRVLFIVLPCVLLPLPLAALLFISMNGPMLRAQQGPTLIPMLRPDERRALLTYERRCRSDEDCEPPLGCFVVEHSGMHRCTDSMCGTDEDCPEGFACLPVKTVGEKALVRQCSLIGERREGEICSVLPPTPRLGCERGFLCQGRCGRPCRLDEPMSCPEGFFCSEGPEGPPSCLPTCEGRSCPEGQQCLPRSRGASLCTWELGEDCRRQPCPKGWLCRLLETPQRPWELRTECRQLCGKDTPCAEGFVCLTYQCRRACDPEDSASCGPGATCERPHPNDPFICMPG
jgi:hypothetical protein